MATIADTSLSADERALLERFAVVLRDRLGEQLHGIWLYGSRARGEAPGGEESDVDVLVLVDDDSWGATRLIYKALEATATELGVDEVSWRFSVRVHTPEWLDQRRAIRSFFIGEVDRDKVVIA